MHAATLATPVRDAHPSEFYAGACKSSCLSDGAIGWYVPYRQAPGFSDGYDAIIKLLVTDLSSGVSNLVSCIIDMATDVTILPRALLENRSAFPESKALGHYDCIGLTGGESVTGQRFHATLSVATDCTGLLPIRFGVLQPAVVPVWKSDYGVLGLDALRRVLVVSDGDHVCFWPARVPRCPLAEKA